MNRRRSLLTTSALVVGPGESDESDTVDADVVFTCSLDEAKGTSKGTSKNQG